eukprot:4501808-Prymnesium_polylepis.3
MASAAWRHPAAQLPSSCLAAATHLPARRSRAGGAARTAAATQRTAPRRQQLRAVATAACRPAKRAPRARTRLLHATS